MVGRWAGDRKRPLAPILRRTAPLLPLIIGLGLLASLLEGAGIGLFIPLLALLMSDSLPERVPRPIAVPASFFGGSDPQSRILLLSSAIFTLILLKGVVQAANESLVPLLGGDAALFDIQTPAISGQHASYLGPGPGRACRRPDVPGTRPCRRDSSYDDLLQSPRERRETLDPRVFISLGSVNLWAGQRPRLFRRLLRRGDLRPNFRTLASLVWTGWASLEPHSLRAFIRMLVLGRNLRAGISSRSDEPVLWSSPKNQKAPEPVTVPAE